MEEDICAICVKPIIEPDTWSKLTEKGVNSLKSANLERQDQIIHFTLDSKIHKNCRIQYCHKREIKKYIENKKNNNEIQKSEEKKSILRSSNPPFSFITDCIFVAILCQVFPMKLCQK